jgi:hypothetical protein
MVSEAKEHLDRVIAAQNGCRLKESRVPHPALLEKPNAERGKKTDGW